MTRKVSLKPDGKSSIVVQPAPSVCHCREPSIENKSLGRRPGAESRICGSANEKWAGLQRIGQAAAGILRIFLDQQSSVPGKAAEMESRTLVRRSSLRMPTEPLWTSLKLALGRCFRFEALERARIWIIIKAGLSGWKEFELEPSPCCVISRPPLFGLHLDYHVC